MTLRRTTILAMCILGTATIAAAFLAMQIFMVPSFTRLENEISVKNAERVLGVQNKDFASLEATTSDWAYWDDTSRFIKDLNGEYIESNLAYTTFVSLNLNAILC